MNERMKQKLKKDDNKESLAAKRREAMRSATKPHPTFREKAGGELGKAPQKPEFES